MFRSGLEEGWKVSTLKTEQCRMKYESKQQRAKQVVKLEKLGKTMSQAKNFC